MNDWFTIDQIDEKTYIISEYKHWEETHCYLLIGSKKALLIDTGLGICNIYEQVKKLTNKPVTAVATHIHWDHIGGHKFFPTFYAHKNELDWLTDTFPLSEAAVHKMLEERCELPAEFDVNYYKIFQGKPTNLLEDGDIIDLGQRTIRVLHTPGHSPGHLCFFEKETGYFFSGDLIYKGTLFVNYPSTNPQDYLNSLRKLANLPVKYLFPGHHNLDISPNFIKEITAEFEKLNDEGKLVHKSGLHTFKDWAVML